MGHLAVQQMSEGGQARLMVGLTGYPNVGKSSTINALFGSKKTAVAATPGKTKHFQTLNITERMTLCDCPGLVLPKFAASKAEMVAAGERSPQHVKGDCVRSRVKIHHRVCVGV